MENDIKTKLIGVFLVSIIISISILAIFNFWLFPTGIQVLEGVDFVDVTPGFSHNLYWFFTGIIILVFIRSITIQF